MTREEQIEEAAKYFANNHYSTFIQVESHAHTFVKGAEWADFTRPLLLEATKEIEKLEAQIDVAKEALEKIADPRKRDHKEPDKYTEVGCMINMADEALSKIKELEK